MRLIAGSGCDAYWHQNRYQPASEPFHFALLHQPPANMTVEKVNHLVDSRSFDLLLDHMVPDALDRTFSALADPTRRGMLAALTLGEKPISELAAPYQMTLAGAAKHVSVLARAGLVERRKVGRQQMCRLKPQQLREASDWLLHWEQFWTMRLDALETALKEDQA